MSSGGSPPHSSRSPRRSDSRSRAVHRPRPPGSRTSPSATRTPRASAPAATSTTAHLPALDARLPQPARGAAGLRAQLPGLLGRDRRRRHRQPARARSTAVRRTSRSRSAATTPASPTCSPSAPCPAGPATATAPSTARSRSSTTRCPAASTGSTRSISRLAPSAQVVVVVGYPRIFMGEDCNAVTWFSPAEETRLNQTADLLNGKLLARPRRPRASGSPTRPARFIGHAVCDNPEWINGLSNPISESYHPNQRRPRPPATRRWWAALLGFAFAATPGGPAGGPRPGRRSWPRSSGSTPPSTARSSRSCSRRPTCTARTSGRPRGRTGSTWTHWIAAHT